MALAGFTPSHGNVSFDEVDPYLAEAAGRLRQTWGADLPVNSAYRSPEYNAKVGGAQNSQHMHGTALDLNMAGMSPEERARLLTAAMDAGFTSFGFYDKHPDMLHVDVREGGRTWGNAPAWAQPIMGQRFKRGMGRVQMAQADTGTMNDAGGSADLLKAIDAEIARRSQGGATGGGLTLDQIDAEIARRQSAQGQTPAQPVQPQTDDPIASEPRRSIGQGFVDASRIMANDVAAGFQGINPIKTQQASPVGYIDPATQMLIGEGPQVPRDKLDPRNWVVQVGDDGREYVYARTPEIEDPALASVGRVVGYGIPNAIGTAARGVATAPRSAEEAIGVTPSFGMRGPAQARIAAAGESFAPTSGRFIRDSERAGRELAQATDRIASQAGPGATQMTAGAALERGGAAASNAITSRVTALYDQVDNFIPKNATVDATAIGDLMRTAKATASGAEDLMPNAGQVDRWLSVLERNGGQLTYGQIKTLRTQIGAGIKSGRGPFSDMDQGWLKQMYGALTEDMRAAAQAAGPEAVKAWERANKYRAASGKRVEDALNVIFKAGSPERAYSNVLALTAEKGGRANVSALAGIKKSIPADEWGEVVGTTIRRMGMAGDPAEEVFSPARFLTAWGKMSPEAKVVLFEGKGVPKGLRQELNALVDVLEKAKQANVQINNSRSGTVMTNSVLAALLGTGFYADPLMTAGTAAAVGVPAYLGARAMTSPPFIRGLRRAVSVGDDSMLRQIAKESGPAGVMARQLLTDQQPAQAQP